MMDKESLLDYGPYSWNNLFLSELGPLAAKNMFLLNIKHVIAQPL